MKLTKEIKTAILVIASILLFIWGYSFLKGKDLFTNYKTIFVKYSNVEGLVNSAPVTINGLIIGKVNSIKLASDYTTIVEMQINNQYSFSKKSVAQLYSPGPIGGRQIAILPALNDTNLAITGDYLTPANKLGLTDALGEKLIPTQQKIEALVTNADKLMQNLNSILDQQTQANLKTTIVQLNQTLAQVEQTTKSVNTLIDNNQQSIKGTLTNAEKVSNNLANLTSDLQKAKLSETITTLQTTLANVNKMLTDMQSGKGSMGKLLKDEAMYNNLTQTSKELELLLQDVRLHPTRYVNVSLFGKKEKPYNAPIKN